MRICRKGAAMPSTDYLIGPASGEIRWYPAIDGRSRVEPPHDESGPWPWSAAVAALAQAARIKQVAASLPEGDLRSQLEAEASRSIGRILDEWCGIRSARAGFRARAGAAALVDRDRRTTRGAGELTPGRLPPRRTAPHRRAGAAGTVRKAQELTKPFAAAARPDTELRDRPGRPWVRAAGGARGGLRGRRFPWLWAACCWGAAA